MDETQPGNASPRAMWMVTFVELVALLVAFFVMLFAMSTIRYDLWDIMVHSLSQRLNPSLGGESVSSLADRNVTTELAATAADLDGGNGRLWDIMVHSLSQRLNPSLGGESVSTRSAERKGE